MKQLTPNSVIQGRYLIVQPLGKGGTGEVYLAIDQRLGSAVALKRTLFIDDSALGNAFEREARVLAHLRHPVLPKVIDHFIEGEGHFLVMEHISGDDMAKRLENAAKPFPLSWVMFWADKLLDALNYLHSHEPPIIHRDIKPQNLKLTDDNHIVLLDFGLSKDFDTTPSNTNQPLERGSAIRDLSPFAAIEQIRGTGTDARSDLYSLSATIYNLLTNTIPPNALTRADAILGGNQDPITPLELINPEVTKKISDILLKGLSIRQDERYSSATEMQKELRRAFNELKSATVDEAATIINKDYQGEVTEVLPSAISANEIETVVLPNESPAAAQATVKLDMPVAMNEQIESDVKTAVLPSPVQPAPAAAAGVKVPPPPHQQNLQVAVAAPKTKSYIGLIIGALLVLMLFGGLAVAGAFYWYVNYYAVKPEPTPSPEPTVIPRASPSPEATQLVEAPDDVNSKAKNETNEVVTPPARDMRTPAPVRQTPAPTTRNTPPGTTKTPVPKATPKPKGDDRTVILQ